MSTPSNSNEHTIVILHGDQTGEELLQDALRVLDPQVIGLNLNFQDFDLSLKNRQATNNDVVRQAAAAMKQSGLGLKAATITPTEANSVGSPNAILREEIDGTVILRVGRRIPGVPFSIW
jgi:isocitrate dehydrogenase